MNLAVNSVRFSAFNNSVKPNSNKTLTFRGADNPLEIPDQYLSPESKNKTVTICGCSGAPYEKAPNTAPVKEAIAKTFDISKTLVQRGYNVLTGCGDKGIMGAGYKGALSAEKDPENPEHNLAFVAEPLWGDEDQKHCKVIGKPSKSENDRIENGFAKASNNFLVFPGGVCSLQEATTLIAKSNYLRKDSQPMNIVLVGKDYYKGLEQQYNDLYLGGTLKRNPKTLFKVIEPEDVLKEFPDLKLPEKKLELIA